MHLPKQGLSGSASQGAGVGSAPPMYIAVATWLARLLAAEGRAWAAALRLPVLYILLAALLGGVLLAVQVPLHYSIDVGIEEGYGGDLPHLSNFNTAERDEHGSYRWTRDQARMTLPGLGWRPVTLQLDFFPVSAQVLELGPQAINLWVEDELLASLPVRQAGAHYSLRIPERLMHSGTLDVLIRTHTFVPPDPDDPRSLGTPLDRVSVRAGWGFAIAPDVGAFSMWLLATVLVWGTLLRALAPVPRAPRWAAVFLGVGVALVVLSSFLDPPRWAFGAQPALVVAALSYLLVLVLRPSLAALATWLDIDMPLGPRTLGWLLLIIVLAFGMRYGGRLYPRSMHGDIGFHTNRFNEVARGQVYLISRNRGVNFPYPPGPYLALAPLTLLKPDPPALLQLGAALLEGLSAILIYSIVARTGRVCQQWQQSHGRRAPPALADRPTNRDPPYTRTALLAAALYVFTAAGFMTTWWSFDTHIYTQFFTLLLLTALVEIGLRRVHPPAGTPGDVRDSTGHWLAIAGVLLLLVSLVYLGHFGFFINTALLGGLVLLLVFPLAWRGVVAAQRLWKPLLLAGVGALLLALLFFYSAYLGLFLEQARIAADSGLTGLADRAPVPRWYLWQVLWQAGMVQHFGFFPLLLAPIGLWYLPRLGRPALVLVALMSGSLLVSSVFAVLPFITQSTQSTRWLMFSAWAIAIGAAFAVRLLWRASYGRSGRLVVIAMGCFVVWNTLFFWVGPMLWRIRPPEPF